MIQIIRRFLLDREFHYGWVIAITGTLCIFACLGLGRFSLGMLLPSMGEALSLTYGQMGIISTSNFVGYLAAVLISSRIMSLVGGRNLITMALILVSGSMLMISRADSMGEITLYYALTGMGSGFANVPIMALIASWFSKRIRGRAAGFAVVGSGFAIILSGIFIPLINSYSASGWRISWLVLGILVFFCSLVCFTLLVNAPKELGLQPAGSDGEPVDLRIKNAGNDLPIISPIVFHIAGVYFLFGFTYVIYVTFIVTAMVQDHGYAESAAGTFWSWVGLLSLVSGPLFGTVSDKLGRRVGLALVFGIQAAAYLLAALPLPGFCLFLSIGCYGIVAWSIPTIITALVADHAGPERVAAIFGFVTFVFGIGQILGPSIAGFLAEKSGTFHNSFLLAAVMAILAVALSMMLPKR